MNKRLYSKLKRYNLQDALYIEKSDRQFLALQDLWRSKKLNRENYLSLILSNSIVCYQLSSTGENYWEEFSQYFSENDFYFYDDGIINELKKFLEESK